MLKQHGGKRRLHVLRRDQDEVQLTAARSTEPAALHIRVRPVVQGLAAGVEGKLRVVVKELGGLWNASGECQDGGRNRTALADDSGVAIDAVPDPPA